MRTKRRITILTALSLLVGHLAFLASAPSAVAAEARFITAAAQTRSVTQLWSATGTAAREGTVEESFGTSGTVSSVKVAVGDVVEEGDTLAKLYTIELKQAVAEAEAELAQAEAQLYTVQHPASYKVPVTTSSSKSSSKNAVSGGGSTPGGSSTDSTALITAANNGLKDLAKANKKYLKKCTDGLTPKQCATATENLQKAITALDAVQKQLAAAEKAAGGSSGGGASQPKVKYKTVTPAVDEAQEARALASVIRAEQQLKAANKNLKAAKLTASVSGTVGALTLVKGGSSSGTVTIITDSETAVVTLDVPLSVRQVIDLGTPVTVTPVGSQAQLSGEVTAISPLAATSDNFWFGASSGDPAYPMTVTVTDPQALLVTGASATVTIEVGTASDAVTIPASALTPTGTGVGTVQVVDSADAAEAQDVEVEYGVAGKDGWIEVKDIEAGQLVVLADLTIPLDTEGVTRLG
ncbi:MAG: HlyD family efflux transporter periplasmic adaptor subunit [Propionibacteriaceae bacterium]|jgi:multidrug efflux pump subunit AcrA (membrane-fusion protein)|nr:HlyD family efflux transporter periplasmic adaptor subunit [Propionibacteriaceae bacterium]